MIKVTNGTITTVVYSGQENLTGWEITLTHKAGRETVSETFPMSILSVSDKRYYLEWTVTTLDKKEYDYEIVSSGGLIDKGILRNGDI